jgi:hypothetical protein
MDLWAVPLVLASCLNGRCCRAVVGLATHLHSVLHICCPDNVACAGTFGCVRGVQ